MQSASNTKDCFRDLVGKHIKGVLVDTLPLGRADLSAGTKTIVFFDGTGLTIALNGSFWPESTDMVRQAINIAKRDLKNAKREIEGLLALAGKGQRTMEVKS